MIIITVNDFCYVESYVDRHNEDEYEYLLPLFRRGSAPEKHQDAAGGLIRTILISLDDLKITEKTEKGGRRISRVGQQALDLVAGQVARGEV